MRSSILGIAAVAVLALCAPSMAAGISIGVESPEGASLTLGLSKSGRTMTDTKSGKFQDGYYTAKFNKTAALYCAKVTTPGWKVVFPDGASTDQVCMMADRLKEATIGGKKFMVFSVDFKKQ